MVEKHLVVCVNQRSANEVSCAGRGSRELIRLLQKKFDKAGIEIAIVEQVCLGRCAEGITMRIAPAGPFFTRVAEQDLPRIVESVQTFTV